MTDTANSTVPRYADLPSPPGLSRPLPVAWDVWGPGDELGTLNNIGSEQTLRALRLPSTGEVLPLSLDHDHFDPPIFGRKAPEIHDVPMDKEATDDYIDGFFGQASSQWDGFRHIEVPDAGFYGGVSAQQLEDDPDRLSMSHWARHGIITRGVVADVAGFLTASGAEVPTTSDLQITAKMLTEVLDAQGATLEQGDVLMIRTGWLAAYKDASPDGRKHIARTIDYPGLVPDPALYELLWDARIAAVVADNPSVEVLPRLPKTGSFHRHVLAALGLPMGELWDLDGLAARTADLPGSAACVVSVPSAVRRVRGGPANAVALL